MRLIVPSLALAMWASLAHAEDPTGMWWTENRAGIIAISPCNAGLCGRIVGQPHPVLPDGSLPRDWRGDVECGLNILDVKPSDDPNIWKGTVLNPRDGKRWDSKISVDSDGNLSLRGYVLTPLLGETQTWTRFTGRVSTKCEIE